MNHFITLGDHVVLAPSLLMLFVAAVARTSLLSVAATWRLFLVMSGTALLGPVYSLISNEARSLAGGILVAATFSVCMAIMVQFLGTVIGSFSRRYLFGEPAQHRYITSLSVILCSVQLLVFANHWVVLILAWAVTGMALHHLLCFYSDRPFAALAAHKKRLADRFADVLLVIAATLAWQEVGTGSLTDLWAHVGSNGASLNLQLSAVFLVVAVAVRTALLPLHGWLIQVMEAPTPVSALLHAGVINLGGYVLIQFAPLLEQAQIARAILLAFGLATACMAGLVMLTRVTVKVNLAWSTSAQMGFMLVECALGLYTLAAAHLVGHSLYKAHAFLTASMTVERTRRSSMSPKFAPSLSSVLFAPVAALSMLFLLEIAIGKTPWPWWWTPVLALAWAPLMWVQTAAGVREAGISLARGLVLVVVLAGAAVVVHAVPLGLSDSPQEDLGVVAVFFMSALYLLTSVVMVRPQIMSTLHRWSYAGFYLDEAYTRLAIRLWPGRWASASRTPAQVP